MQAQLDKFKQDNSRLEKSLEENKLQSNSPVMSKKLNSLSDEVAALRKLRDEMHLEESLNPHLKTAVDLMADREMSINLSSMTVYQEVRGGAFLANDLYLRVLCLTLLREKRQKQTELHTALFMPSC